MSKKIKIDFVKFKKVFLNQIPFDELTAIERPAYSIFVQGISIGREITLLEAVSKVNPDESTGLVAKFVGDVIEESPILSEE